MAEHPFAKGQPVVCVRANDGAPLTEGMTYTVRTTFVGPPDHTESVIEGLDHEPGITVEEAPGHHFMANRFRAL